MVFIQRISIDQIVLSILKSSILFSEIKLKLDDRGEYIGFEALVDALTKGLVPKVFNEHVINVGVVNSFDVFC